MSCHLKLNRCDSWVRNRWDTAQCLRIARISNERRVFVSLTRHHTANIFEAFYRQAACTLPTRRAHRRRKPPRHTSYIAIWHVHMLKRSAVTWPKLQCNLSWMNTMCRCAPSCNEKLLSFDVISKKSPPQTQRQINWINHKSVEYV